ncbi:hypothetical protein [Modestobacter sp. SYSU DS0511]
MTAYVDRYGREPARVDAIDAGSVTALSPSGLELLLDHLAVARLAGRQVPVRRSPPVDRALTAVAGADRW